MKTSLMYIILFVAMCYVTLWSLAFQDDKQMCQLHGYTSNTLSPSLEGVCMKDVAPNVVESIPVENLSLMQSRHEHMSAVAMCIRTRQRSTDMC